jgi:hypothetical protein
MAVSLARVADLDWPEVETLTDDVLDRSPLPACPAAERPLPDCVYLLTGQMAASGS